LLVTGAAGGVTSARSKSFEECLSRRLVAQMKRLRIPLGSKVDDVVGGDFLDICAESISIVDVLEPKLTRHRIPLSKLADLNIL
jgi:hypothetical protein